MKRRIAATVLLAFMTGCTPSPEETCKRLDDLASKEKDFDLSMKKCLAKMKEMKERDPDAYKCASKMAKLSRLDTALLGISICDKKNSKSKKKSSDDDDDDAPKKKKKKSSDDDD